MFLLNLVYALFCIQGLVVQKLMAVLINCREREDCFPILMLRAGLCSLLFLERKKVGLWDHIACMSKTSAIMFCARAIPRHTLHCCNSWQYVHVCDPNAVLLSLLWSVITQLIVFLFEVYTFPWYSDENFFQQVFILGVKLCLGEGMWCECVWEGAEDPREIK